MKQEVTHYVATVTKGAPIYSKHQHYTQYVNRFSVICCELHATGYLQNGPLFKILYSAIPMQLKKCQEQCITIQCDA